MAKESQSSVIAEVKSAFSHLGKIVSCAPYGNGHINDTFALECEEGNETKKYILQRINTEVFKKPERIMENIIRVTEHIRKKTEEMGGDAERATLNVVYGDGGESVFYDKKGGAWRMYEFVEDSLCLDRVRNAHEFYLCARTFGHFQNMLSDFAAEELYEVIADFHNTPKRYENFEKAVAENRSGRASNVLAEIVFVRERAEFAESLEAAHREGKLPLRVTHNDTKLNNVLFDAKSGEPICVIDLDTVMPGYSVNDFGDSIRFAANTAAEDEKDLSLVSLDMELFGAYAKGFIEQTAGKLSRDELLLLPTGAMMMTFECGMRFLTDYLDGDVYFKTGYPEHNLDRCRCQFALLRDMEKKKCQMCAVVEKYLAK